MHYGLDDETDRRLARNKRWRVRAAFTWLVGAAVGGLVALVAVYGNAALYPILWTTFGIVTATALLVALIEGIEWS